MFNNKRRIIIFMIILFIFPLLSCKKSTFNKNNLLLLFLNQPDFTYEVSEEIKPVVDYLQDVDGSRTIPVASYADPNGVATDFVANEVVIKPRNKQELDDFCSRYGGIVIRNNSIPAPPPELGITYDPNDFLPTSYTVRVSQFPDTKNFEQEARVRGASGNYQFSSEAGVGLMALVTREFIQGRTVSPNWVYTPHHMLHKTEEWQVSSGNFINAMGYTEFNGDTGLGSNRSTVSKAWQFLSAAGFNPLSVNVAIIDAGFWLDANGHAMQGQNNLGTDYPTHPTQYDFHEDDYIAAGPSPYSSSNPNIIWHGNGVASVATGFVNNRMAAAGTGGLVANPFLFRFNYMADQKTRALRTCMAWGADVVNMSFGGPCNEDCEEWNSDCDFYSYKQDAIDAGLILVASAGNDGLDVDFFNVEPCNNLGIICVGALADNANTHHSSGWSSNYGASVDIWAPTDIPAMPNDAVQTDLVTFGGTSASAPFVSGVAAMMKAVNPGLNAISCNDILVSRAWKDSTSPFVSPAGYLNAYAAVKGAAGDDLDEDYYENNDTASSAKFLLPGNYTELTLNPGDWDYYRFSLSDYGNLTFKLEYMNPIGYVSYTLTPEDGQEQPSSVAITSDSKGMSYTARNCQPGNYRLLLSASYPQYYYLNHSKTETGLSPDIFEANNSSATAADLTDQYESWELNLHQNTDVDYFLIEVHDIMLLSKQFFRVTKADHPLTLRVYEWPSMIEIFRGSGKEMAVSFSHLDVGKQYLCRIDGPVSRYVLTNRQESESVPEFLHENPFWWLDDPVGPISNVLIDEEDSIIIAPAYRRYNRIELSAQGLSVALYDWAGNLIQEGTPLMGRDNMGGEIQIGETLNTAGVMKPETDYLLRITRSVAIENPVDGSEPAYPRIEYTVKASL